jgi:hypothetical protein
MKRTKIKLSRPAPTPFDIKLARLKEEGAPQWKIDKLKADEVARLTGKVGRVLVQQRVPVEDKPGFVKQTVYVNPDRKGRKALADERRRTRKARAAGESP